MFSAAGIDYSMTSPAIATYSGSAAGFSFSNCKFYCTGSYTVDNLPINIFYTPLKGFSCDSERFNNLAEWAMECVKGCKTVALEDYAMGAKGRVFAIGENGGILKLRLWEQFHPMHLISPTVIKKFATGKGNSKKEQMYEQFVKDTGVELKDIIQPKRKLGSPTTDLVDAYYILKYSIDNPV